MEKNIKWFDQIGMLDISEAGGKNASLGEMTRELKNLGIKVPFGFATTTHAFHEFLKQNNLVNRIHELLAQLDAQDIVALNKTGKQIRDWILTTPFLPWFEKDVISAWEKLSNHHPDFAVAVRSSATAEDLANASFAGQQESFLNVRGKKALLKAIKEVFASLFNDRAIAYRLHQGFSTENIGISVGIQQMVRSDLAASGVMFTIDTESGFDDVIFITSSYGLGEAVVQGQVNPDEFYVYKPALIAHAPAVLRKNRGSKASKLVYALAESNELIKLVPVDHDHQQKFSLNDTEILALAHYALIIEKHYGKPMDIEWAKDGISNELFILQARPETVNSQKSITQTHQQFHLKQSGKKIIEGRSVGQAIGAGHACVVKDLSEIHRVEAGMVLVTDMTDPDWEPIMARASAIVTNRGGRTCHAAIIARELGIPAVVGCADATDKIANGQAITVSCAEGEAGCVYDGILEYEVVHTALDNLPELPVKIMLNLANPDRAFALRNIPNAGVGLARLEFIISQMVGIHPQAILEFDKLKDHAMKREIITRTLSYASPVEYYIEKIREGVATIAAAFYPHPVIVRMSDFKSNEYANLLGGQLFEPTEENPMLGFRGASRYISPSFADCFALECHAIKRARAMGLNNIQVMIPFVRTLQEAKAVEQVLTENGLVRGVDGLKIIMMCEIPSNALLADQFLKYFDGFSIGSNYMTQLTLGIDRDSGTLGAAFDERDPAVKQLFSLAIQACHKAGKYIGICGQGPSDHPELALWLMREHISSLSLNPDSVWNTIQYLSHLHLKQVSE